MSESENVRSFVRGRIKYIFLIATLNVGAGCTKLEPNLVIESSRARAPIRPERSIFSSGDSLELFVEEDPSFNGTYLVREGGYILIPRIGRIQVSGLDREEAENHIARVLQDGQLAKAKVFVERLSSGRALALSPDSPKMMIYLTGSVAKPGVHLLPVIASKPVGLYEALLITGGLTRFGNHGKVELLRANGAGSRTRNIVDIRPIRDGQAVDPPLVEGDIINVREKVFGF